MKHVITAIPLLLLAACQAAGTAPPQVEDQCGAANRQQLLGKPAAGLDTTKLPKRTRVIHPNTAVTMDHRPDRLNVHVGEDGKISRVDCG